MILVDISLDIDVIQDGAEISESLIQKYNLDNKDFKIIYLSDGRKIIRANFVGIVKSKLIDKKVLFSMPKHYMEIKKFEELSIKRKLDHVKLVIKTINKSIAGTQFTQYKHSKYVEGNISFNAYNVIVDYYQKYGLFHDEETYTKKGYGNHISWKKTISRSTKIISKNKKIIFTPFVLRKKKQLSNLVTECMIFAINYTDSLFGYFLDLPNYNLQSYGINPQILHNIAGTINSLIQFQTFIFKDDEKQLVDNLIIFLRRVNNSLKQAISIKDYDYEYVWEKAVEKYLNAYFLKVENNVLEYSKKPINKYKFKKKSEQYDSYHKNWRMEPDHYFFDKTDKSLYIFDSKYYVDVKNINYKQLVYHFLFGNKKNVNRIYDALIVPYEGENVTDIHVNIMPDFLSEGEEIIIYINKLNTSSVLKNYI